MGDPSDRPVIMNLSVLEWKLGFFIVDDGKDLIIRPLITIYIKRFIVLA